MALILQQILHSGKKLFFDHSLQFFTATSPVFKGILKEWIDAGVVREWDKNLVGVTKLKKGFQSLDSNCPSLFVGAEKVCCITFFRWIQNYCRQMS